MQRTLILIIIIISFSSCKKEKVTEDEFTNNISLGTSMSTSSMELTGVSTNFYHSSAIWFRIESVDDMAGSNVKLLVEKADTTYYSAEFTNPQSYGHIFISSFNINETGNYKATGILVNGNKTISSINFTVY
ncbi:MAG: hypothetical protein HY951_00855 [Bacteroidia bacterium]|nr:hypothetical protein [Bacteroidia bacterium]